MSHNIVLRKNIRCYNIGLMQNNHVYVTQEVKSANARIVKIIFLVIGLLLLASGTGITGYYIGKEEILSKDKQPAPSLFTDDTVYSLTPTISDSLVATPSLILSPGVSPSPSPTKKTTPTSIPVSKSMVISSDADLDGYMASNDSGSESVEIKIGRNKYLTSRGFVAFDIGKIPSRAKITQATLRIYQVRITGDPYGKMGNLKVDHLNYGDVLDKSDYTIPAILNGFAVLSKDTKSEWKEIDVTPQILDDISNSRLWSQYRIHFDQEVKGETAEGDFAFFESANNTEGTDNIPQLVIKYSTL